jgi:hypothetical protein
MLDAPGRPAIGEDLNLHPPSALAAVARGLQGEPVRAADVIAVRGGRPAVFAVAGHRVFANSLIGIFSSASNSRSSSARRPRVVR